jgi:hypothetical protein
VHVAQATKGFSVQGMIGEGGKIDALKIEPGRSADESGSGGGHTWSPKQDRSRDDRERQKVRVWLRRLRSAGDRPIPVV